MYRAAFTLASVLLAGTAWGETTDNDVSSAAEMRDICQRTIPTEGVSFTGNAFERGEKRAAHRRDRESALGRVYVVELPSSSFDFLDYDMDAQELEVDTSTGLRAHTGRSVLALRRHESLLASVPPGRARELAELHQRGGLVLRVGFVLHPPDPQSGPCSQVGEPTAPVRVQVEVSFFELRRGSDRMLRVETFEPVDANSATPTTQPASSAGPTVTLSTPSVITEGNLDELFTGSSGHGYSRNLLACYRSRLEARPGLEGTIVVQLSVSRGQLRASHLEIDSLGDPGIASCTLHQTRRFPYPSNVTGAISLPIRFQP